MSQAQYRRSVYAPSLHVEFLNAVTFSCLEMTSIFQVVVILTSMNARVQLAAGSYNTVELNLHHGAEQLKIRCYHRNSLLHLQKPKTGWE